MVDFLWDQLVGKYTIHGMGYMSMFVDLNMCGIQAKKKGSLSLAVDTSQLEKGTSNIIQSNSLKCSNLFTAGQVKKGPNYFATLNQG